MKRLEQKVALVTGRATGLGQLWPERLAQEGATAIINGRLSGGFPLSR